MGCDLYASNCDLCIMGHGSWSMDYGLRIVDYGMRDILCGLLAIGPLFDFSMTSFTLLAQIRDDTKRYVRVQFDACSFPHTNEVASLIRPS